MVRGQYLSDQKLKELNSEERIGYLAKRFGVPEAELRNRLEKIWNSERYLTERLYSGAEYLWKLTRDSKSITSINLGAIIRNSEEWRRSKLKHVSGQINDLFKDERDAINDEYPGLNVTSVQFLRESVVPKSELRTIDERLKELENWPKLEYGKNDWLRGTRLPTKIRDQEATLLGIYWGDGSIKYPYSLQLEGGQKDFEFYRRVVSPLVINIHGLPCPVFKRTVEDKRLRRSYSYSKPKIRISSVAVVTWIVDNLDFPKTPNKTNVQLPKGIEGWRKMEKYAFLKGIIGSMGELRSIRREITLTDKDETFINNLKELSENLGFSPRKRVSKVSNPFNPNEFATSCRLSYSQKQVDRFAEIGLINPEHQKKYRAILS